MDLVFGPSTSQHTVNIPITDDNLLETNETFVLELFLTSLVSNVTVYPNVTTVTILDNEGRLFLCRLCISMDDPPISLCMQ